MDQKRNKRIAKEWHEAFGTVRMKDNDTHLAEDFTADFFGQKLNKSQYMVQYQNYAETFKHNKIVVEDQIAEGNRVVSMIMWTAIHLAGVPGIPLTEKSMNIKGITVDYFKNGKIVKQYPLFDTAQLLKRQLAREQERTRIARDLHDNIGSTLGSISYYSEMAQQLAEEKQAHLKMLLQKIEESSHELVDDMSDIVWAINPFNDSFEKLLSRMRNYAADLLATRNIEFSFEIQNISETLRLSIEQRKNIFLIFKEAIYNAVKYACCSKINALIGQADHRVIVELHDNGKGFDVNQAIIYNGNGINNMKLRAAEIGAEIFIGSKNGKGTQIRLLAPVKVTMKAR
ncbi:MAG: ester cyclase [Chitinophagales bacterium]|nr:ester cyclase [Chitinophagales bacterium]